jgi:solute carrier family 35 (UDP-sugar transporter), member A1/2/3
VLYQLKILTTAVFAVLLLRRRLDCGKWLSLLILVAGVSLVQLSSLNKGAATTTAASTAAAGNTMLGLACVLLACCSSGFAGIWFEKVLKGSECSVWVRNVELALIGGCAGLAGVYSSDAAKVAEGGFFQGYNTLVWCVILLQALGGIVVAVVIKYADNLLKGFATSISIVLSCLVSYAVFGEVTLSARFVLGTGLVILSTLMYSTGPAELCGLGASSSSSNTSSSSTGGVGGVSPLPLSEGAGGGKGLLSLSSGGSSSAFFAHAAGTLKAEIPLTDPEEGQGLLQEIELTGSGMEEAEALSPRPEAASHRRRALFGL